MFFCYRHIYAWHGGEAVTVLAEATCSNDEVLRETFKTMKVYLDDVKGGAFKVFMLITMIAVLAVLVLGAVYKVVGDKKATAPEAEPVSEDKDKKEQVKEPLLNKKAKK